MGKPKENTCAVCGDDPPYPVDDNDGLCDACAEEIEGTSE